MYITFSHFPFRVTRKVNMVVSRRASNYADHCIALEEFEGNRQHILPDFTRRETWRIARKKILIKIIDHHWL